MKSLFKVNLKNVLTLIISVIFFSLLLFSCKPEEPELVKPALVIKPVQSITQTTATLVVALVSNESNTSVVYRYRPVSSTTWTEKIISGTYNGKDTSRLSEPVSGLEAGTNYQFEFIATNAAGSVSKSGNFQTLGFTKAYVVLGNISAITLDSAKIAFWFIPYQDNTSATLEYQIVNGNWQSKLIGSNYSGNKAVNLEVSLSTLQANTKYNVRLKIQNKAGEIISEQKSFTTFAARDWDGNLYSAVTIGTQTWLKPNFCGTHYANGDPIANVTNANTWSTLSTGAYCWYNNEASNGKIYGGLYNWWVGADPRGLIIGWHTPTIYEQAHLGNQFVTPYRAGVEIMDNSGKYWTTLTFVPPNSTGFSALPNGGFSPSTSVQKFIFMCLNTSATFWSDYNMGSYSCATIIDADRASYSIGEVYEKVNGFGLRLIKN